LSSSFEITFFGNHGEEDLDEISLAQLWQNLSGSLLNLHWLWLKELRLLLLQRGVCSEELWLNRLADNLLIVAQERLASHDWFLQLIEALVVVKEGLRFQKLRWLVSWSLDLLQPLWSLLELLGSLLELLGSSLLGGKELGDLLQSLVKLGNFVLLHNLWNNWVAAALELFHDALTLKASCNTSVRVVEKFSKLIKLAKRCVVSLERDVEGDTECSGKDEGA